METEDAHTRPVDQIDALIRDTEQLRLRLQQQLRQRPFWPERRRPASFVQDTGRPGGRPERRAGYLTDSTHHDEEAGHVTYDRLALRIPARCKFCGVAGRTKPEQTIKGTAVLLAWCCEACKEAWPITLGEQKAERRRGQPDTRGKNGKERRRT